MKYVAIDVSSKSFVVHAIDRKKRLVFQGEIAPVKSALLKLIEGLGPEPIKVVFEAGSQMKWLAETLQGFDKIDLHGASADLLLSVVRDPKGSADALFFSKSKLRR